MTSNQVAFSEEPDYILSNIRTLLIAGYLPEELRQICQYDNNFQPVLSMMPNNSSMEVMVDRLLDYAQRRLLIDALLEHAERINPRRYEKHGPYREAQPLSTAIPLRQSIRTPADVFKAGGALFPGDTEIYVERSADADALRHLQAMNYLMIIEPRTQGKSSLLGHLRMQYATDDILFAYADLADLDVVTQELWFSQLSEKLSLFLNEIPSYAHIPPPTQMQEWRAFLRDLAQWCENNTLQVILVLDEVGAMSRVAWAEEFFISLRTFFNERAFVEKYQRVTCVLAGAFDPKELIRDEQISPFNIAQRVYLEDFTREEIIRLIQILDWQKTPVEILAERIYQWTGGQPFLTQLLCSRLPLDAHPADIDTAAERVRRYDWNLLASISESIQRDTKLHGYLKKIQSGEVIKYYPRENPRQAQLELLGIIRADEQGNCMIRNRIYSLILDDMLSNNHVKAANGSLERLALQALRDVLADIYAEQASYRRIAQDAGLTLQQITIDGSAINAWHAICEEAQHQSRIPVLLHVAKDGYHSNSDLQRAELLWLVSQSGVNEEHLIALCRTNMPSTLKEQATATSFADAFQILWQAALQTDQHQLLRKFAEQLADRSGRTAIATQLLQWGQTYR